MGGLEWAEGAPIELRNAVGVLPSEFKLPRPHCRRRPRRRRRASRRHLLRQLRQRLAAANAAPASGMPLPQELAGLEEQEEDLMRQLTDLKARLEEPEHREEVPLLRQHFAVTNRLHEVQQAVKYLRQQQAAEDAAWHTRRHARRQRRAEHAPGGGVGGSSGLASSGGSGSSAETADLQRDFNADLAQADGGADLAQADGGADLAQALEQQLGMGGGGQQQEAPAGGTVAGLDGAHATTPPCEEAPVGGAVAGLDGAHATTPPCEEAPAGGAVAGLNGVHATTPPGGTGGGRLQEVPAGGAVDGLDGEALGGADDDASPTELQPVFGQPTFGQHSAASLQYVPGQERPGELALCAGRGSAFIVRSSKAPRAGLTKHCGRSLCLRSHCRSLR